MTENLLEDIIVSKQNKIKKWKHKYTDVFIVGISDKEQEVEEVFIYRTLGREEYKYLFLNFINDIARFQESVCEIAVLYPKEFDFKEGLAGIPEVISNFILDSSGFAEGQALTLLAEYRRQMYEYDFQVDCMIHEAFPEVSIEEIQMWNNHKTMYYLSRAEYILAGIRGHNITTIEDVIEGAEELEEEYKEKQETPKESTQEIYPEIQQQFDKLEDKETPKEEVPNNSEMDILSLLGSKEASNGRNIASPTGDQGLGGSKMFPELAWFKAESDLKGNID